MLAILIEFLMSKWIKIVKFQSKNIKIAYFLLLIITHITILFGIFQESSIWEGGRSIKMETAKKMDKDCKLINKNIYTKDNFSTVRKMELEL